MRKNFKTRKTSISTLGLFIEAALKYDKNDGRKGALASEAGKILACHKLGLKLLEDSQNPGFDALDKKNRRVEIKTSMISGAPKGRTSRFSEHEFDYALLVLLGGKYELREIWKANREDVERILTKRRQAAVAKFKKTGEKLFPQEGNR